MIPFIPMRFALLRSGGTGMNGYIESFHGKLRDELLNREIFDTILEAKVLVERWRWEYNNIRPHSALGYRPPAPEAILTEIQTQKSMKNWNFIT